MQVYFTNQYKGDKGGPSFSDAYRANGENDVSRCSKISRYEMWRYWQSKLQTMLSMG